MKTSKWFGLTLAAAVSAGGLFIFNAHAASPLALKSRAQERGRLVERVKEKLGLNDEQCAQIKSVLKADKDTITGLAKRMHDARTDLRAAIQASDATEASVRAASAKVAAVQVDLAVERFKLHGKISPILTDEQREKLSEFQARVDDFVDTAINRIGERLAE